MVWKVWIGVAFCMWCLYTSADTDMDCEKLYPECLKACGTDLVEMEKNYQDRNICWLHLNCTQYRSCLNQMKSASPMPPPEVANVTVSNASISLGTSTSSEEPERTTPSSGGYSGNKTMAQPETANVTEREPKTVDKSFSQVDLPIWVSLVIGLAVLAGLACLIGLAVWGFRCCVSRTGSYSGADAGGSSVDESSVDDDVPQAAADKKTLTNTFSRWFRLGKARRSAGARYEKCLLCCRGKIQALDESPPLNPQQPTGDNDIELGQTLDEQQERFQKTTDGHDSDDDLLDIDDGDNNMC